MSAHGACVSFPALLSRVLELDAAAAACGCSLPALALRFALAAPGVTTDAIDALVHDRIVAAGASQRID